MKVYAVFANPRNVEGYFEEPKNIFLTEEHANMYANMQALATGVLHHVGEYNVQEDASTAKFPTNQIVMEGRIRLRNADKSIIYSTITRSYFNHPDASPQPELRIDNVEGNADYRECAFSEMKNVVDGETFDDVANYIVQSVRDKIVNR